MNICDYCGEGFQKCGSRKKYCSVECCSKHKEEKKAAKGTTTAAIVGDASLESVCVACGSKFIGVSSQLYCSVTCRPAHADRWTIFNRDGFRCIYCGVSPITDDSCVMVLDHIYPRSLGGDDSARNLVTCCESCNTAKHARLLDAGVMQEIYAEVQERNKKSGISPILGVKGSHCRGSNPVVKTADYLNAPERP